MQPWQVILQWIQNAECCIPRAHRRTLRYTPAWKISLEFSTRLLKMTSVPYKLWGGYIAIGSLRIGQFLRRRTLLGKALKSSFAILLAS